MYITLIRCVSVCPYPSDDWTAIPIWTPTAVCLPLVYWLLLSNSLIERRTHWVCQRFHVAVSENVYLKYTRFFLFFTSMSETRYVLLSPCSDRFDKWCLWVCSFTVVTKTRYDYWCWNINRAKKMDVRTNQYFWVSRYDADKV